MVAHPCLRHRSSSRWPLGISILVSSALHVAAAAAMLLSTDVLPEYGVLQKQSDAVSVAATQTYVLELIVTESIETTSAGAAAMPQGSVQSVEAEEVPVETEPAPTLKADDVPDIAEELLDVLHGSSEPTEHTQAKAQEQTPEQVKDVARQEYKKKRRKEAQRQRSMRQMAGGPTARSSVSTAAASGRVSASHGSIVSYAARVRAMVARNKPSSNGHRGTAQISFGVSLSGDLSYARLARSSGNAALDEAALRAVQRAAPFGTPPESASPGQLCFSIPFYFR